MSEGNDHDLQRYRRLSIFVGAIYAVWWLAVEAMLPDAYNPLLGRGLVVLAIWSLVPASYASERVRRHLRTLWTCGLWLLTGHYFYLFYENAGDINWTVGSFITVSAICLAFLSRASLIAYSLFTVVLSVALVIGIPSLRQSVFLPGLFTVLLQANIGMHSRLGVLRDLAASTVALQQTNDALARSNLDLQRFAYVASHDLQTPLRSIASFVDLVRSTHDDKLDAEGRDWLGRASRSAEHLQTLVRELLEYSRVEAEPLPLEKVSMREVLDRATSLLESAVRDASATIVADELPDVTGDRSQLVRLVMNLVDNGIKYRGPNAPQIRITVESRGEDWVFAVRDNGIGIAAKHHKHVFEIFKRLHDAKEYPGTGIGLAVCRRIVDRHGGRIWVESEVGGGSVFYFTITQEPRSAS